MACILYRHQFTDQPGIFQVCYPSYGFNSSGPAVILAAYPVGDDAIRLAALSDAEHVRIVLDATAQTHGQVVFEQYTGRYQRKCWSSDEFEAASWTRPTVGQEHLYRPTYFETEHRTILIGEHTSPTHSWIASALESAVRGSVQLLLELGLVDEAKEVNQKWMARWITV
ncbi:hypothetical protein OC846_003743 [Tilletia horrida]|uniref:Amine oxidase domain-containing protein n=1 Tax=Tilletia horrida TaxID=155126 RepID=A0AAN6GPL1_9BASI|nr:hypothetical protein OC845_003589 [Tilletia horrida]KAK0550263.1 hypothetical protein OC846_003743 [Tilletia horrida]